MSDVAHRGIWMLHGSTKERAQRMNGDLDVGTTGTISQGRQRTRQREEIQDMCDYCRNW